MLRCLFNVHASPIRQRQSETGIAWICPRCDTQIGVSDYPASARIAKWRQAEQLKAAIKQRRSWRLIRRA